MTKKESNFIEKTKSNNRITIAKYKALYKECEDLKKCMITFTPFDTKMSTLIQIRKEFARLVKKYKKRKKYQSCEIKYFSNIEFCEKSFIPHIHIQVFFTNKEMIQNIYEDMVSHDYENTETNSLSFAKNNSLDFNYVIKDYITFDLSLEKLKSHYKNVKFYTSSQKSISNKIVKYLYKHIPQDKSKYSYETILELIEEGLIQITSEKIDIKENAKKLKLKNMDFIQGKFIYVFEKIENKNDQKWAYKNKRLIKGRKIQRVRFNFKNRPKNFLSR